MKAARIHSFGEPDVIVVEDVPQPIPSEGEVLVRVAAAGVGPWDAIIREGKSKVSPQPPLTLGSDLSGTVEAVGSNVPQFKKGDEIYGVTNPQFCGAQAEYAVASANMITIKPQNLTFLEAASVPVIAVTAWQMLFEYAKAEAGQTVMILGASGNVGAYAVQFAINAGIHVVAVVKPKDFDRARFLGAKNVLDYQAAGFERAPYRADAIIDTVGGEAQQRSLRFLKHGGILVSVVSIDPPTTPSGVRSVFFYVEVTTARLNAISALMNSRRILPQVGTVLPLQDVRIAHEILAGAPHKPGKILLEINRAAPTT